MGKLFEDFPHFLILCKLLLPTDQSLQNVFTGARLESAELSKLLAEFPVAVFV